MITTVMSLTLPIISQMNILTTLIIVVVFFSFLLILGILKSRKLKKENDRLNKMNTKIEDESEKPYKDFTEGHMYGN